MKGLRLHISEAFSQTCAAMAGAAIDRHHLGREACPDRKPKIYEPLKLTMASGVPGRVGLWEPAYLQHALTLAALNRRATISTVSSFSVRTVRRAPPAFARRA